MKKEVTSRESNPNLCGKEKNTLTQGNIMKSWEFDKSLSCPACKGTDFGEESLLESTARGTTTKLHM